jgi:penicillin G amidase
LPWQNASITNKLRTKYLKAVFINGDGSAVENQRKRNWRRVLRRALLGLLSLVIACVLIVYVVLRASLPKTDGTISVSGLSDSVEVRFDQLQRPYVQAKTFEDALAAQGWLHAAHRLWQMEMFRRAGRGRLAELLGTSLLATDQQLFKIGVPQLAKQLEQNATEELMSRIQAYVCGVNEGIQSLKALPPEFWLLSARVRPWTQEDVFAVGAVLAYQSAGNMQNELFRLELSRSLTPDQMRVFLTDTSQLVDYPFVVAPQASESEQANQQWSIRSEVDRRMSKPGLGPSVLPAMEKLAMLETSTNLHLPRLGLGSNGWCVAPSKTASGNAIFAFDSHDELGLPNLFYEIHLFFGNDKQVRGWSVAGLPGVVNGYNHRIAWGFTNIGDTQDLFLETQHPQDSNQFLHEDAWYTARMEQVEIPVAGQATPASLAIRYTKNGPLISDDPPISLRWTAHEIGELGLEAFLDLNLAENWIQFNAALDRLAAPSLNATYADVEGNIGFRTGGPAAESIARPGACTVARRSCGLWLEGTSSRRRSTTDIQPACGLCGRCQCARQRFWKRTAGIGRQCSTLPHSAHSKRT